MRKIDKKLNIQKANLLIEVTYLKSKGLIEENINYTLEEEAPIDECGMGMYEDPRQPEMEMEATIPMYEEPQVNYKEALRKLEPRDVEGKMMYMKELESFMQELNYVIRREQGGI